jgi:hypothetical protein
LTRRRSPTPALALAAVLAAGACSETPDAAPPPEPRLLSLTELEVAVKRNLQRGALVSFWATW